MTILGPLVSTGGNTYKAFVAASGLPSNDELAVLLNCNGYIQKEVFSLNENEFEAKEIEFKVSFYLHKSPEGEEWVGGQHLCLFVRLSVCLSLFPYKISDREKIVREIFVCEREYFM